MDSEDNGPQRRRHRVCGAAVLCASAYLLAHTFNAWVADSLTLPVESGWPVHMDGGVAPSASPSQASRQSAQDILASGLFLLPPPPPNASTAASSAAPLPPLNVASKVTLIGIVTGFDGSERAVLEDLPSKKQALYRVTQRVPEVGELAAIEKERVLLREGAQEEWLELAIVRQTASAGRFPLPEQSEAKLPAAPVLPIAQQPPGRRIVERARLVQLFSDQSYLTEARFQPYFNVNGKIDGFLIDGIRQVGVLEQAGLRNQDILAGINGVEIRDPAKLWEMLRELQHERTVRLNVVRQSQPMTMTVEIRG